MLVDRRFNRMSVPELKEELRSRGLRVSGTKAELIERLVGPAASPAGNGASQSAGSPAVTINPVSAARMAAPFLEAVLEAARKKTFLPKGGRLGLACMHLYENDEELPQGPITAATPSSEVRLKGCDGVMAVVLARLGFAVETLRFACLDDGGDGLCLAAPKLLDVNTASTVVPAQMNNESLAADLKGVDADEATKDVTWTTHPPCRHGTHLGRHAVVLDQFECPETTQEGTLYTHVAIIARLPAVDERIKALDALSKDAFRDAFDKLLVGAPFAVENRAALARLRVWQAMCQSQTSRVRPKTLRRSKPKRLREDDSAEDDEESAEENEDSDEDYQA